MVCLVEERASVCNFAGFLVAHSYVRVPRDSGLTGSVRLTGFPAQGVAWVREPYVILPAG